MTKFIDQSQHSLKIIHSAVIYMSSVKPKAFDAFFSIFDNIIANFLQNFIVRQIESPNIDLKHLDMFA